MLKSIHFSVMCGHSFLCIVQLLTVELPRYCVLILCYFVCYGISVAFIYLVENTMLLVFTVEKGVP